MDFAKLACLKARALQSDVYTAGPIRMLSLDETKLERRSLARNELLFRQGDKVQAIYFIEEGRLGSSNEHTFRSMMPDSA
jgi:CRP-like cAMP-binding protein